MVRDYILYGFAQNLQGKSSWLVFWLSGFSLKCIASNAASSYNAYKAGTSLIIGLYIN